MANDLRQALAEGLADAAGFVGGALIGWQLGKALGYDVLASGSTEARNAVGWVLLLAGCGAGKWASLRWRAVQSAKRGGHGGGSATVAPKK